MTFVRYVAIQLLAYLLDIGVFILLLNVFGTEALVSNVIAKLCAGLFAFLCHRHFTFPEAASSGGSKQAVMYFILLGLNIPIASGLLALFLIWIDNIVWAKIVADIVGVVLTYVLSKYFIFSNVRPKNAK